MGRNMKLNFADRESSEEHRQSATQPSGIFLSANKDIYGIP